MKGRNGFGLLLAMAIAFVSFGCEGDTGPQGPEGPEGPAGPPGNISEFAYQGDFGTPCLHCHATTINDYVTTNHRFAYDDLAALGEEDNLYCLQCHTTGFNCEVDHDTGEIIEGSCSEPNDGYSGYIGDDSEEGLARKEILQGVQCESCHGPMGPDFNAHQPEISFSTWDNSLCAGCHDAQIDEWETSGHALSAGGDPEALTEEWGRSSCDYCHTSEGFIRTYDASYTSYTFTPPLSQIGCPTCHDPHVGENGGGNEAQLRTIAPVTLSYYDPADPDNAPTAEGYGPGQTCMQCHKARRDFNNVTAQIASGSGHFGPHASPQTDMFIGDGSYEIPGYDYDDRYGAHQTVVVDGCPTCHMAFTEDAGGHIVHNFMPDVENCQGCHPSATDFDVNGVQTEIQGKMDEFAQLLGYIDADDLAENLNDEATGNRTWPVWQREAVYGFIFVYNSGDRGVHNQNYANALLDNAIAYAELNLAP